MQWMGITLWQSRLARCDRAVEPSNGVYEWQLLRLPCSTASSPMQKIRPVASRTRDATEPGQSPIECGVKACSRGKPRPAFANTGAVRRRSGGIRAVMPRAQLAAVDLLGVVVAVADQLPRAARGRLRWPRIGDMGSSSGSRWVIALRFSLVMLTARGKLPASHITCCVHSAPTRYTEPCLPTNRRVLLRPHS